jgi:hypothetical protein
VTRYSQKCGRSVSGRYDTPAVVGGDMGGGRIIESIIRKWDTRMSTEDGASGGLRVFC